MDEKTFYCGDDRHVLRRATIDDAEMLFAWRNDPETRANSRNMDMVAWPDHLAWLTATLQRADRILLVGESGGVPVATIRFDDRGDHQEVSWTGAPEYRGKGHTKRVAILGCASIKDRAIIAEIKRTNLPTNNIIAACGFILTGERDGLGIWRREPLT